MSGSNCPSCTGRFGLFKRKRICIHCKGCFCKDCLVKEGKVKWCHTCRALVRTPYDKEGLLKLSTKDLRSYLQRKHISTFGCSEKQDLVDLIYDNFGKSAAARSSRDPRPSPLDQPRHPVAAEPPPRPPVVNPAHWTPRASDSSLSSDGIRVTPGNPDDEGGDDYSSSDDDDDHTGAAGNPTNSATPFDDGIRVRPSADGDGDEPSDGNVPDEDMRVDEEPAEQNEDEEVERMDEDPVADANSVGSSSSSDAASQDHPESDTNPAAAAAVDFDPGDLMVGASAAVPDEGGSRVRKINSRFPSVSDLRTCEDVDSLSVRECKELLALYRVDFKGICEKRDLLAKVRELWIERQQAKAEATELPDEELCRICMDSKIDCVLLECGHMVSCTLCGKKMNECPICRQYVIRAVHVFRT